MFKRDSKTQIYSNSVLLGHKELLKAIVNSKFIQMWNVVTLEKLVTAPQIIAVIVGKEHLKHQCLVFTCRIRMNSDGSRTGGSSVSDEELGCSAPPEKASHNCSDASLTVGGSGCDVLQGVLSM
jgi:hypothetical protein